VTSWAVARIEAIHMNDTGSLQNLNDIVMPGPVPWLPLAPGWYVVAALSMIALLYLAIRWALAWRRNRYRREALRQLSGIRNDAGDDSFEQLPVLLKQAALAAWSREEVASMSGPAWHRFLDQSAGISHFCDGAGATLDWLAYRTHPGSRPGAAERERLLDATEDWLRKHSRQERGH